MPDFPNPYNSPETSVVPEKIQNGAMTDTMLRYLKEASPWLRFIGVVGFISFGFTCLMGLISIFTAGSTSDVLNNLGIPGFSGLSGFAGTLFMIIFYALMAVLIFIPARFTYNFGVKIRDYMLSNSDEDLETALKNNKSLVKFNGIIVIVFLSFVPVIIIITLIAAVFLASSGVF